MKNDSKLYQHSNMCWSIWDEKKLDDSKCLSEQDPNNYIDLRTKIPDGNYKVAFHYLNNKSEFSDDYISVQDGEFFNQKHVMEVCYSVVSPLYHGRFIEGFSKISEDVIEVQIGS